MQKVALITGAGRRIGAAIARNLHENGMNVALHYYQSAKEAEQLCAELNTNRQHSATTIKANLTEISTLSSLVEQTVATWERLDLVVNNASRFYRTAVGETTENAWDDLLTSNLKAPFFLAQAALPFLQKTRGNIINIIDVHADRPMRDYPVYCVSKAGLVMLTQALAKELGPDVRVNAVSPGEIIWPEGENSLDASAKEKILARTVLQRHGDPTDIAKAVLFLANDADYVTGQVVRVDGGRSLFI